MCCLSSDRRVVRRLKRDGCQVFSLDSHPALIYNQSMIEKMLRIGRLYDCYGALLTENQQKCLELHYLQDLSLGEIAAELSVSRQAINDMLRRAEDSLEQYEAKLNLYSQEQQRMQSLRELRKIIMDANAPSPTDPALLTLAVEKIDDILKQEMRD